MADATMIRRCAAGRNVRRAHVTAALLILFIPFQSLFAATDAGAPDVPTQQTRVALVIGNAEYRPSMTRLSNPALDARRISAVLRDLGFTLIGDGPLLDATRTDMQEAVVALRNAARPGGVAFVFYAGHAVETQGTNYLAPVDAEIDQPADVSARMIALEWLIDQLDSVESLHKVIFLDACRDDPFTSSRRTRSLSKSVRGGLAPISGGAGGAGQSLFIGYAAAEGETAPDGASGVNSRFSGVLAAGLAAGGQSLGDAFASVSERVQALSLHDGDHVIQTPYSKSTGAAAALRFGNGNVPAARVDRRESYAATRKRDLEIAPRFIPEPTDAKIARFYIQTFHPFRSEVDVRYLNADTRQFVIGYGRRARPGDVTDRASEDAHLALDLAAATREVELLPTKFSAQQRAALLSFIYNAKLEQSLRADPSADESATPFAAWRRSSLYRCVAKPGCAKNASFGEIVDYFVGDAAHPKSVGVLSVMASSLSWVVGLAAPEDGARPGDDATASQTFYARIAEALLFYLQRPANEADLVALNYIRRSYALRSRSGDAMRSETLNDADAQLRMADAYFDALARIDGFFDRKILGEYRRAALASFLLDTSEETFLASPVFDYVRRGDYSQAAEIIAAWRDNDDGRAGVLRRRAEAEMLARDTSPFALDKS